LDWKKHLFQGPAATPACIGGVMSASGEMRREYKALSREIHETIPCVCRNGWFVLGNRIKGIKAAIAGDIA
jgi:hypothetical protein